MMERILDTVERIGNRVPHPAVIFLILVGLVIALSHVFYLMGVGVSYQTIDMATDKLVDQTTNVNSLLTTDGIRFLFTSMISNFMSFGPVGVILVAMIGVGLAEQAGLVDALIKKIVAVAPRQTLTFIIVFLGVISSIASDAGYLVLVPLGAAAFLSVGRHPLAGIAAAFSGTAAVFLVNVFLTPTDGILTELTNDAIHLIDPSRSIDLAANLYFMIVCSIILAFVCTFITDRVVEPRLGPYRGHVPDDVNQAITYQQAKGLRAALYALIGCAIVIGLLTVPSWAPLRDPVTGDLGGNSPLMRSLIVVIMLIFLAVGLAYGIAAQTIRSSTDAINAIVKTFAGLAGMIFLLLIIAQFIAYFNYSNLATVTAVKLANILKDANLDSLVLLVGFIFVVAILDFLITGALAKWAIFAPIFVPLLLKLNVGPEAVLAAYRVGDSPINAITPLNVYFGMVVGFCQKYDPESGVGTVVAMMLPYVINLFWIWTLIFIGWYLLALPFGP
ncbi:MAG: AbgT family transporter [Geminicoccaceae bacterium]